MGFRFFRRIKIAPGLFLNLSKSGISTSVGPRGAKLTLSKKGIRRTIGIPGTGLYHTKLEPRSQRDPGAGSPAAQGEKRPCLSRRAKVILILGVICVYLYAMFADPSQPRHRKYHAADRRAAPTVDQARLKSYILFKNKKCDIVSRTFLEGKDSRGLEHWSVACYGGQQYSITLAATGSPVKIEDCDTIKRSGNGRCFEKRP